ANQGYSLGGLILNVSGKVTANYWLDEVYDADIAAAHRDADLHIHDLDMLAGYCAGWSLRTLLNEGLNGVPGRVEAGPPKHPGSAPGQMVNFLGPPQKGGAGGPAPPRAPPAGGGGPPPGGGAPAAPPALRPRRPPPGG
ncbi:anaerobic ribonucleoside-triphosphate reductase, partial [Pseudomonas aeruginosa]|uniref:anaerobic ribonucleoside-triphosphate reductase n=1 Tax=Pseudomonas aeruginosa TaxID=287 RepID=UPI0024AF1EF5